MAVFLGLAHQVVLHSQVTVKIAERVKTVINQLKMVIIMVFEL